MEIKWSNFHNSYTEEEVNRYVPTEAGIYLLWVQLKSDKWRCFYVGKADNLKERFLNHLSSDEKNECLRDKVSKYICGFEHAIVLNQNHRDGIEKYLYDYYSPECNRIDPGGRPITVNLP
jgi:excinuclease UvrABC nuclease subunit